MVRIQLEEPSQQNLPIHLTRFFWSGSADEGLWRLVVYIAIEFVKGILGQTFPRLNTLGIANSEPPLGAGGSI